LLLSLSADISEHNAEIIYNYPFSGGTHVKGDKRVGDPLYGTSRSLSMYLSLNDFSNTFPCTVFMYLSRIYRVSRPLNIC